MRTPSAMIAAGLMLAMAGFAAGPSAAAPPGTDLRAKLQGKLKEMEANHLAVWEQEDLVVVTEPDSKGYKIVRADGSVEFAEQLPAAPAGIAKLYVRQNPPGFALVVTEQGRQFVWMRLHWHTDRQKWLPTHPNLAVFQREERLAAEFLRLVTSHYDQNTSYRIPIVMSSIARSQKDEGRAARVTELRELTKKIGESWGGTALLDAVYDINMEIPRAAIEQKVALAKKRRALLDAIARRVQAK